MNRLISAGLKYETEGLSSKCLLKLNDGFLHRTLIYLVQRLHGVFHIFLLTQRYKNQLTWLVHIFFVVLVNILDHCSLSLITSQGGEEAFKDLPFPLLLQIRRHSPELSTNGISRSAHIGLLHIGGGPI